MNSPRPAPVLHTPRLTLRMATVADAAAIVRYFRENEAHFAPTDPPKPDGFFSEAHWCDLIEKAHQAWQAETRLPFWLFKRDSGELAGTATFSQMFRGPFQACYLGYGIAKNFEGQGLMSEALREAIRYLFEEMNFHRVMANHLPENVRSARVLQKLGFEVEGHAKNYLLINGQWRDHVLNSLTNQRWRPLPS